MDHATTPSLRTRKVSLSWSTRSTDTTNNFKLTIPDIELSAGDTLLLKGSSGSGKTTILTALAGLMGKIEGKIAVNGTDLYALSGPKRDAYRANLIGVVFQQLNLIPYLTPIANVLLPFTFQRTAGFSDQDLEKRAFDVTSRLGVNRSEMLKQSSSDLSVGQQQRIAIARAVITRPAIVLADEPTAALDDLNRDAFLDLLFETAEGEGAILVMSSHDPAVAERFSQTLDLNRIQTGLEGMV
ncbi:MAG: ABC transporter ATP-binding protein [Paracoccaceae bacterium]